MVQTFNGCEGSLEGRVKEDKERKKEQTGMGKGVKDGERERHSQMRDGKQKMKGLERDR